MKTKFFAFAALAMTLAACNNDNNENLNPDGPVAARFTAAIGTEVTATTRVSGTEGTDWDANDCIGITCTTNDSYKNLPYVTEDGNGNFTPQGKTIYFNTPNQETFSAYYPYNEKGGILTVKTDAEAQKAQGKHDFLFAEGATGSTYDPWVEFNEEHAFRHCMSKISLTFKGSDGVTIPAEGPTSYTLEGLLLEGTFDTGNGQAVATANTAADVTLTGNLTSTIFFPQEVNEIGMEIFLNNNVYTAILPVEDDKLQSGKEYHYDITIYHNEVKITGKIIEWALVNKGVNVYF